MGTVVRADSFAPTNLQEHTELSASAPAGATSIQVTSTQGYVANSILYVGQLSRETCEKATVSAVTNATTLALNSALKLDHASSESVWSVVGSHLRIYRAADVDGTVPPDDAFSVLATREIDADQTSTYYNDPTGSSAYWYRITYYDPDSQAETPLSEAPAFRGDDFGHYCSLPQIRTEAGFTNALNLRDSDIDQQRRAAEREINSALGSRYTVPFDPVPGLINTITIQLAAGLLMADAYGSSSPNVVAKLKDVRAQLQALHDGLQVIPGLDGTPLETAGDVRFYPDESAPRAFSREQTF